MNDKEIDRSQLGAKEYAYQAVRKEIVELSYKPGQLLRETELCKTLGVSRISLRESMQLLARERLVDIIPQKGTYVSLIDLPYIHQIRFVRDLVEREVIKEAFDHITENALSALHHHLKMQKLMLEQGSNGQYVHFDNEFHKTIFKGCGREDAWHMIANSSDQFLRARLFLMQQRPNMREETYAEHIAIYRAIKDKKAEGLDRLIVHHLSGMEAYEEALVAESPDFFTDRENGLMKDEE